MRLSALQQFILNAVARGKGIVARGIFEKFFEGKKLRRKLMIDTVTKTLERMIDKGLMTGYGMRTPKKWFIREVRVTPLGKKIMASLIKSRQWRLPISTKP